MNNGWECPKCGRVYAPYIDECKHCNEQITLKYISTASTSGNMHIGTNDGRCFFVDENGYPVQVEIVDPET